jgi:serine/threonine-protein kinase
VDARRQPLAAGRKRLVVTELTGPLVLPADVLLVPVAELSASARRQLPCDDGDVAVTRPRLRTPSRLVDAGAARLLRQFTAPSTVVEAVIRHSRDSGADPEATLEAAYPLLARLVREGFLMPAADAEAAGIEATWSEGDPLAGTTVLCRVQVLEDTEVYQVRGGAAGREAALKIERQGSAFAGGGPAGGPAGGAGEAGHVAGTGTAAAHGPRLPAQSGAAERLAREAAILVHLASGGHGDGGRDGGGSAAGGGSATAGKALAGPVSPRLLAAGRWRERRYLVLEWCAGVDALTAAAEALELGGAAGRTALLALCGAVAGAYARLHRRGVLHGDVHPRNVLVAAGGAVRLIDFGLAWWRGGPASLAPAGRGGVAFYFEPEHAAALLAGEPSPPPSTAGEQYGVAALLYRLATGAHHLDFSLERETMLRQIAAGSPLPFAERGAAAWPELEAVLGRALARNPADRFPSLAALAEALRSLSPAAPVPAVQTPAVETPAVQPAAAPSLAAALRQPGPAEALLAEMLERVRPGGPLWQTGLPEPPFASLQYGAAGIACALYRIALAREDAELLSQADLWAERSAAAIRPPDQVAARDGVGASGRSVGSRHRKGASRPSGSGDAAAGDDPAFYNARLDITPDTVGRASLFHTAPGVRCTAALIASALDDRADALSAAAEFVAAASQPCPNPDLTLGRSGLLLGCAVLASALSDLGATKANGAGAAAHSTAAPEIVALLALGDELLAGLWREIDRLPAIPDCLAQPNLGMAHGWAGYLYATLRWCLAAGRPLPAGLAARLGELAETAESWGRGARWRWYGQPAGEGHTRPPAGDARWMPGWCNGSAGMVHLWTLASRTAAISGDPRWPRLASAAAWHAWEAGEGVESLCCGLAGRAYALLALHQLGAGPEWLARARTLADRAASVAAAASLALTASAASGAASARDDGVAPAAESSLHSLYRGALGVAVLAADLERPEAAAMPLVGDEGWTG